MKPFEEIRGEIVQHQWKYRIAVILAAGLLASLLTARVQAQSQPPQYVTTVWQTEQGLPQSSVNALAQDHDGYLWVGTFGGLARFDGERFTVFGAADTPGFGSDRIFSLYESRSGVLWIGTVDGGLTRLRDGVATTYTERDGLPSGFISSIREDAAGNVWINTSRGVARFGGTKLEPYTTHRGKAVREFFLQARDGSMWFRSGTEVVRFGPDGSVATLTPLKPSVFLLHEAGDGTVWIAFRDQYRLVRYDHGSFSDVPLPPIGRSPLCAGQGVLAIVEDTDAELLLLTPAGLVRVVGGRPSPPEAFTLPARGRELPKVRSLLVDREGNRWVGTIGTGLVRLRRAPLTAYAKDQGLSDSSFSTVFQDREGRIWLGGDLLYWFDGHRFRLVPGVVNILTIAQTRDGDLWFGGYGGVYRFRAGVLSYFKVEAAAVRAIYEDREGTLWIGALTEERPGGLYRLREGKLEQVPGISDVRAITEDRDGGLWLGGLEGLWYRRGSKTFTYKQKQGLSSNTVYDIHQDSTGTLWVATYGGGLNRWRDGRFKAITTKDGLPSNLLLGVLEDGNGNLWLSSNQGVFRLSLNELNDFADGKISSISPVSYGVAEGMRSSESNDGSPGGWKTTDGRMWFPTLRGVVAINPTAGNRLPPPVVMEEAWANKLTLAREGQTSIPPGDNTLDFRFTALSFSAPEKVRFKYRLVPFDKDWVDAGTRRTAHYTNMAPGKYSFQVVAANSYGIWNDQGASVRFVLKPHFYQTLWFRVVLLAGMVLLAGSAYRLRVRQLHARAIHLKQLVDTLREQANLLNLTHDTIFVTDMEEVIKYWNRGAEERYGWTAEQAVGRDVNDLLKTVFPAPVEDIKAELMRTGRWEGELVHTKKDGTQVVVASRWSLERGEQGAPVAILETNNDITQRKRAEEALRRSEAYLAEAQRMSHTGSWASDGATREPVYWSEEMFRILGFDPQKGIPTKDQAFHRIHPEDRAKVKEYSDRTFREGVDYEVEYRIVLPDGTVKYIHALGHPVLSPKGDIVEVVGTNVDITEHKRAEEALRRLNRDLRALSNCNQTLLHATDEQSLLEDICRIVCEEAGYRMAWVAYAEHDEAKSVRPVAWTGAEEGYLANLGITWADTERGQSPTGTAIRRGKTCCIQDFATDPRLAPWGESVLQHGFLSGIALPLKDEHASAFGSLSIYSAQPNAFTSEEIRLLEELAADLAFGIVTLRSRAASQRAEEEVARLSFALDRVRDAAFLIDDRGRFHYVNEEACRVLGYTRAELLGLGVEDIDPEFPAERWADHWRDLQAQRSLSFESRHRTRDGRIFPVEISANYFEYGGRAYNLALVRDITERKTAEEALKQSEAYLAEAQRLSHTGSWALDVAGNKYVYCSEECLRIYGFDPQEGLPTREAVFRRIHPEDLDRVTREFEKSLREKVDSSGELRIVLPDGTVKDIHVIRHPVLNSVGDVVKLVGTSIDITERKRAEQTLRQSEAYLAEAQRLSHTGSWAFDLASNKYMYASEEIFRIFEMDAQEGPPNREAISRLIHSEDWDRVNGEFEKSVCEKVDASSEFRIVLPSGAVKHLEVIRHPVMNDAGDVVKLVGTVIDMTERKRAGEALRESETRFRTFVDHAADAFFMLDEQGTIIDVNRSACESLGYTRQELIGMTPMAFDVNLDRPTLESVAERTTAGETVLFDRHWHRRKEGSLFPVEVQTSVIWHGGRRFLLKVARDISDRLRAEEQRDRLRQLEADLAHINRVSMMGELAASIAHEVNQPLSGVVSNGSACLRWLAGDVPNLEEAREAARRIVRDGKRAAEVIARVRALAKRAATPGEKLDLNETIREVLALVGDEAKRKSVMIRTQFADDLSPISGDRVQLQQVMLNLVMNAIEAMSCVDERARELVITTRNIEADQVQVTVKDSGPGIDPNTIDKIFDPFYTTKPGGMGMGLSISRSILQAHGGRLWAVAKDGPGTIFHFSLPKYHEEESNAAA
jgi:PAS domain S-box-containing protein